MALMAALSIANCSRSTPQALGSFSVKRYRLHRVRPLVQEAFPPEHDGVQDPPFLGQPEVECEFRGDAQLPVKSTNGITDTNQFLS